MKKGKDSDNRTHQDHDVGDDCLEAFDHVYAYLNDEIDDPATLERIEHHLSHCRSCYSRAEMERRVNQRLKESKQDETTDRLRNRLQDLIDEF